MFHVYYNSAEREYKLSTDSPMCKIIATFYVFDMAYQYVMILNKGTNISNAYSRWAVRS